MKSYGMKFKGGDRKRVTLFILSPQQQITEELLCIAYNFRKLARLAYGQMMIAPSSRKVAPDKEPMEVG